MRPELAFRYQIFDYLSNPLWSPFLIIPKLSFIQDNDLYSPRNASETLKSSTGYILEQDLFSATSGKYRSIFLTAVSSLHLSHFPLGCPPTCEIYFHFHSELVEPFTIHAPLSKGINSRMDMSPSPWCLQHEDRVVASMI